MSNSGEAPVTKSIALIATDLDGTLLTSAGKMGPVSALRLKQAAASGVKVVLATTRNPYFAAPICYELGINGPMICSNGAQVWATPDGPSWSTQTIPGAAAMAIACLADQRGWEIATTVGQTTFWLDRPGRDIDPLPPHIQLADTNAHGVRGNPVRILVTRAEAILPIQQFCQDQLADVCSTDLYYRADGRLDSLGIFAKGADKGAALRLVLDRLSLTPDQALVFGDNLNDLAMFACAGTSVAMANAPDEVKRSATLVAPSNDDDGIAWTLDHLKI